MLSLRNSNFPWIKIMSRHNRNMKFFIPMPQLILIHEITIHNIKFEFIDKNHNSF